MDNPCSRCGKQRIVLKTWKENVGTSTITRTSTICPDPECQKKVEKELADQKEKRDQIMSKRANSQNSKVALTLSRKTAAHL